MRYDKGRSSLPLSLFQPRRKRLLICPSGGFLTGLSSLISDFPKNISVPTYPKSILELSPSRPTEGRIAIVTDAGRDAVDAAALGAQRDGRAGSYGPVSGQTAS